jgi:hypothetical protein
MNHLLTFGSHKNADEGVCLLEACSVRAGEPFSDRPDSVCFVLSSFLRKVNDLAFFDDESRTRVLSPLIDSLVSSSASDDVQKARAYLLTNSTLLEMLPLALRTYSMSNTAEVFEALPPLTPENIETVSGQYKAALAQIKHGVSVDEVPPHLGGLLTLVYRAAKGAIKALSQMNGSFWKYQAEEVALCAAHAYSWVSDDDEGDPDVVRGLTEETYSLMVSLVNRAVAIR